MPPKLIVKVIGDTTSFERSLKRSSNAAGAFNRDIERVGRGAIVATVGFRGLGRSIAFASGAFLGGAGIVAGLKASITGFSSFTDEMQQAVGLAGVAQNKVAGFSEQILKLATVVGKSPQELAQAFYFIASSGIAASKAMDVLTNAAKASAAGLGDTQTVADAVTSAINAYGAANLSASKATDVLVATVREGKGEASSFAPVIGNVAALAAQLGVSFDQVGAALAAMTRLGTDAETSSTQLQRIFSTLVKVTPQSAKAFKSVGLNADTLRAELAKPGGLLTVLQQVQQAFGNNLPALAKAFGDVRAIRGVLALVGKQADSTATVFKHLADNAGSTKTAFDAVSKDTAQQFRRLRASAEVAAISIGALLAPIAGRVASALASATNDLTAFFNKLGEARGFTAKLNVVFRGLENIGQNLTRGIEEQIRRADFGAVASRIGDRLRSINWPQVISSAAHALSDALVAGLNGLRTAVERVNWQAVGKAAVDGIAAAIGALAKFLSEIKWKDVAEALVKTLGAALRASWQILIGTEKELGSLFVKTMAAALSGVGKAVEKIAIQIVLKIVEPFTHLPFGLGGPFQRAKAFLQLQLEDMRKSVDVPAQAIGAAISIGIAFGLQKGFVGLAQTAQNAVAQALAGAQAAASKAKPASGAPTAATTPIPTPSVPAVVTPRRKGITTSQRNTFFDNALTRMLDRVQDIPTLKGQLARLKQIAEIIRQRIAVTKDITRGLTLEDDLVDVLRRIKTVRSQLGQGLLAALQLNVDRAGLTKSAADDLAALQALKSALQKQIRAGGDVAALEGQLVSVLGQIQQARQQQQQAIANARNSRQFKALGLTATGDDVIPGTSALKRQLNNLTKSIEGSFLDTKKTQSIMSKIRSVLSGGLGAVGRDVRSKIKDILDGLDQELKNHQGDQTKFKHIAVGKLLQNVTGLSADQRRQLAALFAQVGAGGTVPGRQSAAFSAAGATNIIVQPPDVIVQPPDVVLDGRRVSAAVKKRDRKAATQRVSARRGPWAGRT